MAIDELDRLLRDRFDLGRDDLIAALKALPAHRPWAAALVAVGYMAAFAFLGLALMALVAEYLITSIESRLVRWKPGQVAEPGN